MFYHKKKPYVMYQIYRKNYVTHQGYYDIEYYSVGCYNECMYEHCTYMHNLSTIIIGYELSIKFIHMCILE